MYYKTPLNVLWSINFHFDVHYIIFLSSDRQAFYLFIVLNKSNFPRTCALATRHEILGKCEKIC